MYLLYEQMNFWWYSSFYCFNGNAELWDDGDEEKMKMKKIKNEKIYYIILKKFKNYIRTITWKIHLLLLPIKLFISKISIVLLFVKPYFNYLFLILWERIQCRRGCQTHYFREVLKCFCVSRTWYLGVWGVIFIK